MRLKNDLYDYQETAVAKLMRPRVGALFMDMGTGKTRCAIELVYRRRRKISRVIVFAPVSLKETWRQEIEKHVAGHGGVYVFDDKTTVRDLPDGRFWYIIGIESMSQSDRVAIAAQAIIDDDVMVIVDESDKIKGHQALRTERITRYTAETRYRLALTGTPMSQGVEDLYAQMRFLSPQILGYGSWYSFAANHLEYSEEYPGMVVRAHNKEYLAAKMAPYTFQITKNDAGLNLPEKLYDTRYFTMTWAQRDAYEQAKDEILRQLEESDTIDSYIIFQLFGALQQIVSGFWNRRDPATGVVEQLTFPHRRLETLEEALAALPVGEKVIIWTKFHFSVQAITAMLAGQHGREAAAEFHGDLSEAERAAEIERWRGEGARFLVATAASGGRGLTLNEAKYAIFYENEFKYAHRIQAEDRNHRIGQRRRPTYIDTVCSRSIDTRIMESLANKEHAAKAFARKIDRYKSREDMARRMIAEEIKDL
jgi:SNF2 family DNA or RNA helicase